MSLATLKAVFRNNLTQMFLFSNPLLKASILAARARFIGILFRLYALAILSKSKLFSAFINSDKQITSPMPALRPKPAKG